MRTRSQSREQRPPPPEGPPVVIEPLRIEYPFQEDPPVDAMADTRIWLNCSSTHEGFRGRKSYSRKLWGANNFELKHGPIVRQTRAKAVVDPKVSTVNFQPSVSYDVAELKGIIVEHCSRQEETKLLLQLKLLHHVQSS
ncbi:hypothetical protein Tco_1474324 [Tanacetum coccineum]